MSLAQKGFCSDAGNSGARGFIPAVFIKACERPASAAGIRPRCGTPNLEASTMTRIATAFAVTLAALLCGALHAAPIVLVGTLSGAAENPPNASPGSGTAILTLDDAANSLRVQVVFAGLVDVTTAAHIHCCVDPPGNIGVATELPSFTGFPLGVTAGTYDHTFDTSLASFFNPAFLAANGADTEQAADALFAGLLAGRAYLNIHTLFRPGGEIRAFFAVPEPSTLLLLGVAALAGGALRRRST
jgi:hypothetical protein